MASRFSVEAIFRAVDRFTAPVTAMQNRIGRFTRSINNSVRSVNNSINSVSSSLWGLSKTGLAVATVSLAGLTGGVIGLMHEFSKVEDATANFTPLMGGVTKARQLVDELNKAAAVTPFRFEDLAGVAQQLLPVMNGDIQNTIKTIKMLGDTSGGNAQKLDSITRGFTKAMLKGKVDLESLNMIGEAGVPIFTELAASMGKKVNPAFFKMISAGKVSTAQLSKAFERMTSAGGIFFQGMEIASQTTTGMWSSMLDEIGMTAAMLGEILAPTVKELIGGVTSLAQRARAWVKENQELIRSKFLEYVNKAREVVGRLLDKLSDVNKTTAFFDTIVNGFLAIGKAINWVIENGPFLVKLGETILILAAAFKVLGIVLGVVNLLLLANPIGLIVVAVVAAVAAIASAIIWWDELIATLDNLPFWAKAGLQILAGPVLALIDAIRGLGEAWDWVSGKFKAAKSFLGFGDSSVDLNTNSTTTPAPQVVSPQDRTAQAVNESRTTSTAELLIKDSTGRAELSNSKPAPGISFIKTNTGAFAQ